MQELIAYLIVAAAVTFSARKFFRQFTQGEKGSKCAKCELNKMMVERTQNSNQK